MASKERFIYLILLILGGIYIYYTSFSDSNDYVDDYNTKIENLEQKVDSIHNLNNELTIKIDTLNTQIVQLDQELDLKDNKINNLNNPIYNVDGDDDDNDDDDDDDDNNNLSTDSD